MRVTMLVRNPLTHDARVEKEARTLARAGHAVTVVAEAARDVADHEEREGYRIVRVHRALRSVPGVRFLAYRNRMVDALVATAPDVLHAHDADALEPVGTAARRLRVPYVYDSHELWLKQTPRERGRAYWSAFLAYYGLVERRYVPGAAAAITVSPPIAVNLERRYGRPFEVVPNYPDVQPEVHARDIRALPGAEGIPPEAPIVLRLGGLTPGRGVEQLVEAMSGVPAAHLVLLGQGPGASGVAQLAARLGLADRVHVLAPVPEAQVVDYAASADVGVSPAIPSSLNDAYSMPNKLFQYMAAGIPVVASDFAHLREIVAGPKAGVLADMRDPAAIARAIASVLADHGAAAAMGRNGQQAVIGRFNWGRSAQTLLAIYARLAQGAEPTRPEG